MPADSTGEGRRREAGTHIVLSIMMSIGVPSALRAVALTRSTASARSSSCPASTLAPAAVVSSTAVKVHVRLGGSSFLSAGAVGLSARVGHAITRKPVKKRVVSADASAAAPAAEGGEDKGKSLRVIASLSGWYFLNAVFGEWRRVPFRQRGSTHPRQEKTRDGSFSHCGNTTPPLVFGYCTRVCP